MTSDHLNKVETPTIYDPKTVGESLKEMSVDVLTANNESINSYWYHSHRDADLYFWVDNKGNVIKQKAIFFGQVAQWNIVEGVQTGYLIEEEGKVKDRVKVMVDEDVNIGTLKQALEMLDHVCEVEDAHRKMVMGNFINNTKISGMDPDEFFNKFGRQPKVKGFWARIWSWITG